MKYYPRMDLDYSVPGEISEIMRKCVDDNIEEFLEDITASVVMLVADQLFDMRTTETQPKETEGRYFHRTKARLLFLCKIFRPDIHLAVAFMTTRVKEPTDKDWKNMARVLAYLKETPEECL